MKDLKKFKFKKSFPVKTTFEEVIFLNIAIENGLDDIKNYLLQRGYNIVNLNYSHIDAIIYLRNITLSQNISSSLSAHDKNGILMINSYKKTNTEIERILSSRLYSPLF